MSVRPMCIQLRNNTFSVNTTTRQRIMYSVPFVVDVSNIRIPAHKPVLCRVDSTTDELANQSGFMAFKVISTYYVSDAYFFVRTNKQHTKSNE